MDRTVKLTKPQREVLEKLDRDGVCPTTTSTMGRYVNGTTTAALERRGLVQAIPPTFGCPERMYGITNKGREALRALRSVTDAQWTAVFEIRCRSKRGQVISTAELDLCKAALAADRARYEELEKDVFNKTAAEIGSRARRR